MDWCICGEDMEMEEPEPMEQGIVKQESNVGVRLKFFTLQEFKDKYYDKEI